MAVASTPNTESTESVGIGKPSVFECIRENVPAVSSVSEMPQRLSPKINLVCLQSSDTAVFEMSF